MVTFTVVDSTLLRSDADTRFEVHVYGCRELRQLNGVDTLTVQAERAGDALEKLVERFQADDVEVDEEDFHIQACCQPSRVRAAGRVHEGLEWEATA